MNISNNFTKLKPLIMPTILGIAAVGLVVKIIEDQRQRIAHLSNEVYRLSLRIDYELDYKQIEQQYAFVKSEYENAKAEYEFAKKALEDANAPALYDIDDELPDIGDDWHDFLLDFNKKRATYSTNPAEPVKEEKPDEVSGS